MNYRKIITLVTLIIGVTSISKAQLEIDGEFRTKGLVDHGFFILAQENSKADYSVDQRIRFNVNYKTEKYKIRVSLQDARIWGGDDLVTKTGVWGNSSAFGVHEAWVDLKLGLNSNLKIGRQEWNYDNKRILASRNWLTPALSYDGLLFQTQNTEKGLSVDLGLSYNNNGSPAGIVDNSNWQTEKLKTMNFLHIKKDFTEKTNATLLFVFTGKTDVSNNSILGTGTHGLVLVHNKNQKASNGLFASVEGYYQHGTDLNKGTDGKHKDISAYLVAADLGFRTLNKRLELSIGGELISGRDYSNTEKDYINTRHSFDMFYGARFPYYGGNMNHFIIQDSYLTGTKGGGYFDPYLKVKYKINKKNIIEASVFSPILTTKVLAHTTINYEINKPAGVEVDQNGNPIYWKGDFGQYIDLAYSRIISSEITFKTGVSYASVSDLKNQMVFGYEDVANKQLYVQGENYIGWVMLIIKPSFYKD